MDRKESLRRVIQIQAELDVRKSLFDELDRLILELKSDGFKSEELDGLVLTLKDNFADDKNVGWTRAAIKRFEIEVISKELNEKRKRRAK